MTNVHLVAAANLKITDSAGTTITFAKPPKRIISLYSAFNEILCHIGAESTIVARTAKDSLPQIQNLPVIGTHMRPNLELIAAFKPDLVLQLKGRAEAQLQTQALRNLGLNVLEFQLNSFADIFAVTKILGKHTATLNLYQAIV